MDFTDKTEQELYEIIDGAQTELGKRQTRDVFEQQVNELYESARASGAIKAPEQGEQWKQPLGAHDAYAKGDVVTHDGVQWVSTVTPNTWAPTVSGWRQMVEDDPETGEPQYPEYQQPTGAHDGYQTGERVLWQGDVYEAVQDGVVWNPSDYPAAWKLIN